MTSAFKNGGGVVSSKKLRLCGQPKLACVTGIAYQVYLCANYAGIRLYEADRSSVRPSKDK